MYIQSRKWKAGVPRLRFERKGITGTGGWPRTVGATTLIVAGHDPLKVRMYCISVNEIREILVTTNGRRGNALCAPRGVRRLRVVTILRYTLRSDVPKKLNSDNQRDSVTKIQCSRPLLCSSLVFSNVCRQSSNEIREILVTTNGRRGNALCAPRGVRRLAV